jgi:DNA-binding CsgD family transcriptional regulator
MREAPLVERDNELDVIERLLATARAGDGGALVIEGPPGIGKSRLLAAARAAATGFRIVSARASELEREFPFAVVRQLLEPVLVSAESTVRDALLAGAGVHAETALSTPNPEARAEPTQATLHGLYWFTANLAALQPVLVMIDDAQWIDDASLRWLLYLGHRLDGLPLGAVVARRPDAHEPIMERLEALARLPEVVVVRPRPLSATGTETLIERILTGTPERAFVEACQAATAGNPFLLHELLDEVERRGVPPGSETAAMVSRLSSEGIDSAVRGRLRGLGPAPVALARAVAVLGDGVDLRRSATLAQVEPEAAAAADALATASILQTERPLAFVHPLVRASVYGELSAGDRADWHARAAALLEAEGAPADRIAVHLLETDPRGDSSRVTLLRRAAAEAQLRGAPEAAAAYLERALHEPPEQADVVPVLSELGIAEMRSGRPHDAAGHLRRAFDAADQPGTRAAIAGELASALMFTNRAPEAVEILTAAIDETRSSEHDIARTLAAMRALAGYSSLEARRRLPVVLEDAPPPDAADLGVGDRLRLADRALSTMLRAPAAEARALALRALGHGELLAATGAHAPPLYMALNALTWAYALDEAQHHLDAAIQAARADGSEDGYTAALHFRTPVWWFRGALADVEADARAALDRPAPFGFPVAAVYLAHTLVERGTPDGAEAELREAGLDAQPHPPLIGVLALDALARIRAAQQRPEEALQLLRSVGRIEDAWEVQTPSLTSWRADAAVLLLQLGHRAEAAELAAEAVRRAEAFGAALPIGVARRAIALVSSDGEVVDRLLASIDVLRASGARLELARSHVEHGAALRRLGRRGDARAALAEAIEVTAALGATALATRAHDELVAAGARPRRDPIESRTRLTASELRVARIAAEGMTNREVAQALFLTEKTIESHLRNVYRKLEIGSRTQLPRALAGAST